MLLGIGRSDCSAYSTASPSRDCLSNVYTVARETPRAVASRVDLLKE